MTPSGKAQKRSRNIVRQVVKSDGKLGGFALPAGALGVDDAGQPIAWHPATIRWWDSWRASPQATKMMTEPDWSFLYDTARMHHEFWSTGGMSYAPEIRLRVSKFGATPEDRARLHIEIDVPDDAPDVAAHGRHDTRRDRWSDDHAGNVIPITAPKF